MPLSQPAPRQALHHRRIEIDGYARDDGLWDIEARMTDVKSYGFDNEWRGRLDPGDPLHDMRLRLTLDDRYEVIAVEASSDATPFEMCPAILPNFQRLVGLTIGPGWRRAVAERVGGIQGCTHLVELLGPIGTVAFQTIAVERERRARARREAEGRPASFGPASSGPASSGPASPGPKKRPPMLDTCHALATTSPVVRRHWPEFQTGPADAEPVPE